VASFYRCVLCRSNADLRKEGEREVTARHDDRASVCSRGAERSEAAMAGAGVEATLKGFLSVRQWQGGELDRGHPCVHAVQRGAPAHPGYAATRSCRQGYAGV
jgi:hypothetical protein